VVHGWLERYCSLGTIVCDLVPVTPGPPSAHLTVHLPYLKTSPSQISLVTPSLAPNPRPERGEHLRSYHQGIATAARITHFVHPVTRAHSDEPRLTLTGITTHT
jgi:hypothetical protein